MKAAIRKIRAALLGMALVATGCATTSFAKLQADAVAVDKIGTDIVTKCGAQLLSFVTTVKDLFKAAPTYEDFAADVLNASIIAADVRGDIAAVRCVMATIRDDMKATTPAAKLAWLDRLERELQAGQSLDEGGL